MSHEARFANPREARFQWYLAVARTICAMSPAQLAELDRFRAENPDLSDADWPTVVRIVGPKPGTRLAIVEPIRRRA